jgi:carbon monoxide dehydrogenase subunit G
MRLDNEFTVGVPIDQAWSVLTDLELIAPCMPGAQLTGVNDGVYTGKVKIKVGPVTAEYAGTAQFTEKDAAAYKAVIDARGRDSRGQGNANAVISAQLRADGDSTVVTVGTDLTIAGRVAQFGSGMIAEVSAKLLGQFTDCLEARLGAGQLGSVTEGSVAAGSVSAGSAAGGASPGDGAAASGAAGPPGASAPAGGPAAEPAAINLMSVAGGAIYKRLIPVVIGIIVIAVIIVLIVR